MSRSYRRSSRNQVSLSIPSQPFQAFARVLLPLVRGVEAAKKGALALVHSVGVQAMQAMLVAEAETLVGSKGKHQRDRTRHHWGSTSTQIPFGGRRVRVTRPRVRTTDGEEVRLPYLEDLQATDPMPERVLEQILLGVSTRGYAPSLEPVPEDLVGRGTTRSNVSRHLIRTTTARIAEYLKRRLDDVELIALFVDGVYVSGKAVIIVLGITTKGEKVVLGLWSGSTENNEASTALLQDLVDRGLKIDETILVVIDGAKGLRRALENVFGDLVKVQRCQLHKIRNVIGHLPEYRRSHVRRTMRDAYKERSATQARRKLQALASWLERNGEDGAAGSLREGLEETLTIVKLGLTGVLRKFFSSTNAIENLVGTIRRVSRNVKRWRADGMVKRWCALGVMTAERRFRRIKGCAKLGALVTALREKKTGEGETEKAA